MSESASNDSPFTLAQRNAYPEMIKEIESFDRLSLAQWLLFDEMNLNDLRHVMQAIPACQEHGSLCIPHALEWIALKQRTPAPRELTEGKPKCCFVAMPFEGSARAECMNRAEWQIIENNANAQEIYTEACSDHIGYLFNDAKSFTIIPIE